MRRVHLVSLLVFAIVSSLPSHAVAQSKFFSFERDVDRPGSDFSNTASNSPEDCSFACQLQNHCRAWTFVRPGIQGPSGRCFFKDPAPRAVRNNCCTSGARLGRPVPVD